MTLLQRVLFVVVFVGSLAVMLGAFEQRRREEHARALDELEHVLARVQRSHQDCALIAARCCTP